MSIAHARVRRWTRQEYERMAAQGLFAPGERVELIEGEIVATTPQGSLHATAVTLGRDALVRAFGGAYTIRDQLPLSLGERSMPEPAIAVVPGVPRDYRGAHPAAAVLILEVADTTLQFDRAEKASVYAAAGIQDYWILNLVDRVLEVYRDPGPLPGTPFGHGYRTTRRLGPDDRIHPLAAPTGDVPVAELLP